jgi:hypothetical protein
MSRSRTRCDDFDEVGFQWNRLLHRKPGQVG